MDKPTLIGNTLSMSVFSQGNGAFITLENRADGRSVFLQGDDAAEFMRNFEEIDRLIIPAHAAALQHLCEAFFD